MAPGPYLALRRHRFVRRWPGECLTGSYRARVPWPQLRWPSGHVHSRSHLTQDLEARLGPAPLCLPNTAPFRTDPPFPLLPLGINAPHILSLECSDLPQRSALCWRRPVSTGDMVRLCLISCVDFRISISSFPRSPGVLHT